VPKGLLAAYEERSRRQPAEAAAEGSAS
jgi:hypothetical protein